MHIKYMIHSKTKKLGIKFCHLRLSISSNWLLNIPINLENTAIKQFEKDEVVHLDFDILQLRAIDNIDIATSFAIAMSPFNGTAALLHQKLLQEDAGEQRNITTKFSNNKS